MKELYSEELFDSLRSAVKRYICTAACILAATFVICTAVCFFVDRTNATWLKLLNILISGIGGCVVLYWLFDRILPSVARQNYLDRLLFSEARTVAGRVADTGRDSTVSRYVSARELRITDDMGQVSLLYWDIGVPLPELDGRYVAFLTVQKRIVAYEVTE